MPAMTRIENSKPLRSAGITHLWQGLALTGILAAVLVGLTLVNYRFASQSPGGNDFVPRWLNTRLWLTKGISPYSEEAALAVQEMIYGHPAEPGQDKSLFAYPIYSMIVFAPYSLVSGDYALARALWMTTLQLALIGLAFVSLKLAEWRLSTWAVAGLVLFTLLWYHSARPLINGNVSILIALFIATGLLAIRAKRDILAGLLLTFATIKPQVVILLIPVVLIWSLSNKRWGLIASFLGFMSLFVLAGTALEPDWLWQNIQQVFEYPSYTLPGNPAAIFEAWWSGVGRYLGWILGVGMAGILIWRWREIWGKDFQFLLVTAYLTLAVTNLIGFTTAASNFIALYPGLILLLAYLDRRYARLGRWLAVVLVVGLLFGLWVLFGATVSGREQNHIMFFPLPVMVLVSMLILGRERIQSREIRLVQ